MKKLMKKKTVTFTHNQQQKKEYKINIIKLISCQLLV